MSTLQPPPLSAAVDAFRQGQYAAAENICLAHIKSQPSANAFLLLGRLRTQQSRFNDAWQALDRASTMAPNDAVIVTARGQVRLRQGREAEALQLFERACKLDPKMADARLLRAECVRRFGDPDAALALIGELGAQFGYGALVAGRALADRGDAGPAIDRFRIGLAMEDGGPANRVQLHQELGKALEQRGDYAGAFAEFTAAKTMLPTAFEAARFTTEAERLCEFFSKATIDELARPEFRTKRPVFIVGMPRSGTTLLEKMIAAHPQGAGAGETGALRRQIARWVDPADATLVFPEILRTFTAARYESIAREYLAETAVHAPKGVERVADKNLHNWLMAGLIAVAFPDAAMIHIERDPIDVGFSCFERLLVQPMPWSANLEHVGLVLGTIERVMQHWHDVLPGRMLRVRYEELVRDPRGQMTRVLDFIGLPWDDAVLKHEARKRKGEEPAPTLSGDQVKRPIYDESIGRAARFGAAIDPLRKSYAAAAEGKAP